MRYVYIHAYTCCNLGDDMFIDLLLKRYPQHRFYLFSSRGRSRGFLCNDNLKLPSRITQYLVRLLRKIRIIPISYENEYVRHFSKALIWIGGSIFIESSGWEKRIHKSWYNNANNIFYISSNFGPTETDYFEQMAKIRIGIARDCCFRDKYSYNLFKDFANVRYAPDALFAYPYNTVKMNSDGVAISVIDLKKRNNLKKHYRLYIDTIVELCVHCLNMKLPVTLIAFCKEEGDCNAIDDILDEIQDRDQIKTKVYDGDIKSILSCLDEHKYIVATRFHAMIIGWSLHKQVFPIIYSDKQMNVLNDLLYEGNYWTIGDKIDAEEIINSFFTAPIINVDRLKTDAEQQFKVLDSFLNVQ